MATVAEHEAQQIDKANETGRLPVVFVHGLWLLANGWESWATSFEEAGYTALTPGWPDDPVTVDEARAHPHAFAGKTIKQIADHYVEVINRLAAKPAVIGHSFGGLLTQMIAGRGLAADEFLLERAEERFAGRVVERGARRSHRDVDAGLASAAGQEERAEERDLRVDRGLVQPAPAALDVRVPPTAQLQRLLLGQGEMEKEAA
jgi:pimeloyl-ACP methyl ester carboxylesterase